MKSGLYKVIFHYLFNNPSIVLELAKEKIYYFVHWAYVLTVTWAIHEKIDEKAVASEDRYYRGKYCGSTKYC